MLKLIKEKMLVSLVLVILAIMVFGSVESLATVIRPTTDGNTTNTANTVVDNTVGATGSNTTNTNTNKNTNTNTNKANAISSSVGSANKTNTSKYNNTNTNTNTNKAASKLPYAGTNSSMVFVVVALVASAIYAYKKVADYNI